jgi:hypothetical protein
MATKNKFAKNLRLNNKEIRGKRADFIVDDAKTAQEELVRKLSQEYKAFERKLINLEDLSPDTTQSLHPSKNGFDATNWVNDVQSTKVAMAMKKVEVEIAEKTLAEYFTEEEETAQ